jgi:hypothetical protein
VKCDAVSLNEAIEGARLFVRPSRLFWLSSPSRGLTAEPRLKDRSWDCSKGVAAFVLGPAAASAALVEAGNGLSEGILLVTTILLVIPSRSEIDLRFQTDTKVQ